MPAYEPTVPTEGELHAFLQHTQGQRWYALYLLLATLPMRRGEVLALTWDHVDLERAELRIVCGKTTASRRTLACLTEVVTVLRAHAAVQAEERARWQDFHPDAVWNPDNYVFVTSTGTPINPRNLPRHFKQALQRAGLSQAIRIHDFRHAAASILLRKGSYLKAVQRMLGHTTPLTTLKIYAHVVDEDLRDAAERMRSIGPPTPATPPVATLSPEQPRHSTTHDGIVMNRMDRRRMDKDRMRFGCTSPIGASGELPYIPLEYGGAKGIRTPDPLRAKQMLPIPHSLSVSFFCISITSVRVPSVLDNPCCPAR
ncbi:MAG: site-specific integrase [Chloroflexaceae bacterium]|nr:site-specific integrase [Chloroflexaceae bacterium]